MMIMMMMMIIIIIIHGGKRMAYICPIFRFQKSSSTGSLKKHMNTHLSTMSLIMVTVQSRFTACVFLSTFW